MKNLLILLICFFLITNLFGQVSVSEQLLFEFNKAEIVVSELEKLDNLILSSIKQSEKITKITITGHTDNFGSDSYNETLSNNRAKAVVDRIILLGISPEVIVYQGFGESNLLVSKGDKTVQKENRRVQIDLKYIPKIAKKPVVEAVKLTLPDLYQDTKIPYSTYKIRAGEETFIEGKKTRLQFADNAFNHLQKGTTVEVRMTEYYEYSDMILANLTTEINGKMLQTNGMIHVETFVNGQPTNMTGQAYVWFPKAEGNDMMPYFGEETEQGIVWIKYGGNTNETVNLRNYYNYLNYVNRELTYRVEGQKLSRWQEFRHKFLFGKESYLNTINGYTVRRDYEKILYAMDTLAVYEEFDTFLEGKENNKAKMQAILDYEILSINQLGWINCDRFYETPQSEKRDLTIAVKPNKNLSIKMICKAEKGIMAAYPKDENYQILDIPKDLVVTIIAIRTANDKPELAIKTLSKIENLTASDFVFTAFDNVTDLRKALEIVN